MTHLHVLVVLLQTIGSLDSIYRQHIKFTRILIWKSVSQICHEPTTIQTTTHTPDYYEALWCTHKSCSYARRFYMFYSTYSRWFCNVYNI